MKNTFNKILAVLGALALLTGLFLDFSDIRNIFNAPTDISGEWYFVFHTKESSYKDYIDAVTEYKMHVVIEESHVDGSGETWKYNHKILPFSRHRPLSIEGTFKKDMVNCKFHLKGGLRETTGSFRAAYRDDQLLGTFSGTAADTKGVFYVRRAN